MSKQLTWLITGTSSGISSDLVTNLLSRGDGVIATARSLQRIQHLKDLGAATLALDVTSPQAILDAIAAEAVSIYGHIDVLVNNAGYMVLGTLEDIPHSQWVEQYNTNVFGAVNVTQALLPHFRERKQGTVVWIGSVGGWWGNPVGGSYCSSKFALQGIAESFGREVAHLGIRSVIVEPGNFRTSLLTPSNVSMVKTGFKDYEKATEELYGFVEKTNGNQPGDPTKLASTIADLVRGEGFCAGKGFPERLIAGSDALATVRKDCEDTLKLLKGWEEVSVSMDL